MSNNIGSKFEDFIILKVLNHGQYGFVAKVKSKIDNNIYSMKRVDLNLIKVESTIRYYKNEYDFIKKKFDHQNVYKPISCFKQNNIIYIITEYMDGGNLTDLYGWYKENNQKMEEKRLLKIFIQCLRGLRYIHEQNIIHRYLKQDTIILDSNDHVKIINFKYAIEKDKNDKNKIDIGILTAPEMKNKEVYDEKVDVYSLGIIFSSLAYLSPKLPSENNRVYSDKLYNAIEKMKKERTERPTSEESFLDFTNIYYNPIIAYLKSFLHCSKDLLKLESRGIKRNQMSITYKIIELMKINDKPLGYQSIELIERFSENGIDINDIEPKKFIKFLLSEMDNENKEKKEKKENDLNKQKAKIENNKRKEVSIKENDEEIKNNKSIISEIFLVTKFDIKECTHCNNSNYYFKNENYIEINSDLRKKEKGDIKKTILENLNNYEDKKTPTEHCDDCNESIQKKLKTKYYKLSKYLIIFIDKGIKLEKNEMKKLDIFNFDNKEVESFKDEHEYKLISMLTENNGSYNYYYRKVGERFSKNNKEKNNKGETVHSLEEISDNIIILYYCDTKQSDNENINNNNEVKTRENTLSTAPQSINSENKGIIFNNNINFIIGNNNNNIKFGNGISKSNSVSNNFIPNSNQNNNNPTNNNNSQQNNANQIKNQSSINVRIANKLNLGNNSNNNQNQKINNFFNQPNNNNIGQHSSSSNQIRNDNMELNLNNDENHQHS